MIKSFYYLPDEGVRVIDGIADFDALCADERAFLWVDMCKPTDEESYVLTHDFKFHPLAIEDVISERSNTKIDDYGRYLFLHQEKLSLEELKAMQSEQDMIIDRIDEEGTFIEEKERV